QWLHKSFSGAGRMDITIIFKIAAIGIITAIAAMLLKKAGKDEIATVVSVAGLIVAFVMLLDMIGQLYETLKWLFEL
ncbi:MAG: stage III sporulation protein AC, partial [Candidatus Fimimonas sp.]